MIKKCLNCDKEFEQPEGKREKKFCSDNCRAAFNQKNKSEFVRVPRDEWEKIKDGVNEQKENVSHETLPENSKKEAMSLPKIKAMCPKELTGLARTNWIFEKRKEFNI